MNLTPKQLTILQLIRDSRIHHGYSPTMQEIADALGISKVTAFEHVETLIKRGVLDRERNKARSLTIAKGVPLPDEKLRCVFHWSARSPRDCPSKNTKTVMSLM